MRRNISQLCFAVSKLLSRVPISSPHVSALNPPCKGPKPSQNPGKATGLRVVSRFLVVRAPFNRSRPVEWKSRENPAINWVYTGALQGFLGLESRGCGKEFKIGALPCLLRAWDLWTANSGLGMKFRLGLGSTELCSARLHLSERLLFFVIIFSLGPETALFMHSGEACT